MNHKTTALLLAAISLIVFAVVPVGSAADNSIPVAGTVVQESTTENTDSPEDIKTESPTGTESTPETEKSPETEEQSPSETTTPPETEETLINYTGATAQKNEAPAGSAVTRHGKLSVNGANIVDMNGEVFQLRGMSTLGVAIYPEYISKECFSRFRDYGVNCIRLAMYTQGENNSYIGNEYQNKELIDKGVQYCTELGMYVIIDWHILSDGNPNQYKSQSIEFFDEMSAKYKDHNNVIYEICNEPNGCSWNDVKSYADTIIPVIRKNDPDSIVIVGTPTYSQDIHEAAKNPLTQENVVYAMHFYASSHQFLKDRMTEYYNKGMPIIISEFGTCDYTGNGANNLAETAAWLELCDKKGIGYINWNVSHRNESSSCFYQGTSPEHWNESNLREGAKFVLDWIKTHPEK